MTFRESISTCFSKFADGQGRATRSEFWYFYLFYVVVWLAVTVLDGPIFRTTNIGILILVLHIGSLALIIPNIAAAVRRMHDIDKSGWFVLIPIYNLVLLATPGTVGPNRFGPDPADAANWASPAMAYPGQDFSNFPNPGSGRPVVHTGAPTAYAPTQKTRYPGWLGWALLAASPIVGLSPFIIGGIGAQLTCDGGLAAANEANCGWAALGWFALVTIPAGALLFVVGLVMGIVSAFRNG
jgi:uncharacterized membrane protein YhaH (DUF805 family)